MSHSVLPPSAAHEWMPCPGWLKMQPVEHTESAEASEGTLRHAEGAELLKLASIGQLPEKMHPALVAYVELCQNIMRRAKVFGGEGFGIEQSFNMPSIHPVIFGTCDFFVFAWPHLWVIDYKHGHRYVEVLDNPQLICYASGLMDKFKIDGKTDQELQVHMHIVGPNMYGNGGPVYSWDCNGSDLRGHINKLRVAAENNISGYMHCEAGGHCRDCKARLTCKAAIKSSVDAYLAVEAAQPYKLDSYAIGNYYALLKSAERQLKSMLMAIEPELLQRMRKGERIPGWTEREKMSALKWQMPDEEILQLSDMLELGLKRPAEPMTPTQAIKAGVDKTIIQQYAARESAGLEIVPEDTTRARKVFAND